jgi:uncharacterized membrane protein
MYKKTKLDLFIDFIFTIAISLFVIGALLQIFAIGVKLSICF